MKPLFLIAILISSFRLQAQPTITSAEWFIDQDPGFGQGNAFDTFTPDTLLELGTTLQMSNLTPGIHYWYARVKNSDGHWSHTFNRSFLVLSRDSITSLDRIEWFWDIDPGYGQANAITNLNGDSVSVSWTIDLSTISPGIHDLYVRIRNHEGIWSHTYQRSTLIKEEPDAMISSFNYVYRDGSGQSATFSYSLAQPMHYVDLQFDPDTSTLVNNETYEFCIAAIRTDSVQSFDRCSSFTWTGNTVGLDIIPAEGHFDIFPNPNPGKFILKLPEIRTSKSHFRIVDRQGKVVLHKEIMPAAAPEQALELTDISSGLYFGIFEMDHTLSIKKIIIQ